MTLHWTPIATAHLRAAYEYVAADNEAAADRLVDRILEAVEMLGVHPHLGRVGRARQTRELVIAGTLFVVVYRLARNRVEVLAVFHGARKWPDAF